MFRQFAVRAFIVVAVVATGGVAVAAVHGTGAAAPAAVAPLVVFPPQSPPTAALISACGGHTLNPTIGKPAADQVDQLLAERSLHAAALAGNPLSSGTGFQAGVDDALHIQSIDKQLAALLCPPG